MTKEEWLTKLDDILYDLKDETSIARRCMAYEDIYKLISERMLEELKKEYIKWNSGK